MPKDKRTIEKWDGWNKDLMTSYREIISSFEIDSFAPLLKRKYWTDILKKINFGIMIWFEEVVEGHEMMEKEVFRKIRLGQNPNKFFEELKQCCIFMLDDLKTVEETLSLDEYLIDIQSHCFNKSKEYSPMYTAFQVYYEQSETYIENVDIPVT